MSYSVKLTGQKYVTALYVADPTALYRSLDGGVTWSLLPFPSAIAVLNIVWTTPMLGFAAIHDTTNEGIWRTIDGGETWTKVLSGSYNWIDMVDGALGYACGDAAAIYRTLDGGDSWASVGSVGVGTANLNCIAATRQANGQVIINAVGALNSGVAAVVWGVRTVGGGETWTGISSGGGAGYDAYSRNDIWRGSADSAKYSLAVVSYFESPAEPFYVGRISTNTGITWSATTSYDTDATVFSGGDCAILSPQSFLATNSQNYLFRSVNGGGSWLSVDSLGKYVWGIGYLRTAPSRVWVITTNGAVFSSHDAGASWSSVGAISAALNGPRIFAVTGYLQTAPSLILPVRQ